MKKFGKVIALAVVMAVALTAFVSCGCGSNDSSAEFERDTTPVDLNKPQAVIEINDYDGMQDFMTAFSKGDYDNSAVKITGISEHRGTSCSILQKTENGSSLGVSYEIENGKFPDDYPENGAKVTLTGAIRVTNALGYRAIVVPKDKIVIEKD